jgi:hypothetical protein
VIGAMLASGTTMNHALVRRMEDRSFPIDQESPLSKRGPSSLRTQDACLIPIGLKPPEVGNKRVLSLPGSQKLSLHTIDATVKAKRDVDIARLGAPRRMLRTEERMGLPLPIEFPHTSNILWAHEWTNPSKIEAALLVNNESIPRVGVGPGRPSHQP